MSKETQKWLNLLSNNPLCRYNKLVKCQCDHVTSLNVFDKLLILLVFPPSLKENIALFRNGIILFYSSVFKKLTTWRVFTKLWGRHLGIWYMSPKVRYDMLALLGLGFLPTWKDWGGGKMPPPNLVISSQTTMKLGKDILWANRNFYKLTKIFYDVILMLIFVTSSKCRSKKSWRFSRGLAEYLNTRICQFLSRPFPGSLSVIWNN